MAVGPLDYLVSKNSNGSYFGAGPNQLSTSFIGLRGKQEIADNLYAVFNLQTQFDPASGTAANGVGSVVQNNGLALTQQNAIQRFFQGRPDVQRRGLFRYQFADLRHADHGPAERADARTWSPTMIR